MNDDRRGHLAKSTEGVRYWVEHDLQPILDITDLENALTYRPAGPRLMTAAEVHAATAHRLAERRREVEWDLCVKQAEVRNLTAELAQITADLQRHREST